MRVLPREVKACLTKARESALPAAHNRRDNGLPVGVELGDYILAERLGLFPGGQNMTLRVAVACSTCFGVNGNETIFGKAGAALGN